jgi:hypothetical protein
MVGQQTLPDQQTSGGTVWLRPLLLGLIYRVPHVAFDNKLKAKNNLNLTGCQTSNVSHSWEFGRLMQDVGLRLKRASELSES